MKAIDVRNHLREYLPKFTDLFSDQIGISSISAVSGSVTVDTDAAHGLSTGNYVTIVGVDVLTPVSVLTQIDGIASCETASDHDLTLPPPPKPAPFPTVTIQGADQAEYNGAHTLLSVPNRRNFTFEVDSGATSPATGTIFLEENRQYGFNGRFEITVTSATQFTYELGFDLTATGTDDGIVHFNMRIDRAVNLQRFFESYTKQDPDKFWLAVIPADVVTSRDRRMLNDATALRGAGSEYRIKTIHPIWLYAFIPTRDSVCGGAERDFAEDLFRILHSSIAGVVFPEDFTESPYTRLMFVEHGSEAYHGSFYVHRFHFENEIELTDGDTFNPGPGTALRNLEGPFNPNDSQNNDVLVSIDFDEQPL